MMSLEKATDLRKRDVLANIQLKQFIDGFQELGVSHLAGVFHLHVCLFSQSVEVGKLQVRALRNSLVNQQTQEVPVDQQV